MKIAFFLFILTVFCAKETSLVFDASNPTGLAEKIALIGLNSNIAKFSSLFSDVKPKTYAATVDHTSWLGKARSQSAFSWLTDTGCGSCTTFATIAAAELAYYKVFQKKASFSEMELVDCMYLAGGCNGNQVSRAFKHVFFNGVSTRLSYPYRSTDLNVCKTKATRNHVNKFVPFTVDPNVEDEWKYFIDKYGGFALQMYSASGTKFKTNSDGIIISCGEPSSNPKAIDHAVSVVGYGKLNGVDYLLVRNSWGTAYHTKGYFKLKVGACNSSAWPYYGFIYDTCASNIKKNACESHPACTWSTSCKNKYIDSVTDTINALRKEAPSVDALIDKYDGVGLNNLSKFHALRKSTLIGSEFMCYLKAAGKTNSAETVDLWYKKAVEAGYVNKKTRKIVNYSKLRSLLGIKESITTTLVTKAKLDSKYQSKDKYRFHILNVSKLNLPSTTMSSSDKAIVDKAFAKADAALKVKSDQSWWDPRYNQYENDNYFGELYAFLGNCVDGTCKA